MDMKGFILAVKHAARHHGIPRSTVDAILRVLCMEMPNGEDEPLVLGGQSRSAEEMAESGLIAILCIGAVLILVAAAVIWRLLT